MFVPKLVPSGNKMYGVLVVESIRLFQYWKPAVKLLMRFDVRSELRVKFVRIRSLIVKFPSERSFCDVD